MFQSADELVESIKGEKKESFLRIATVKELFERGTAKILFDGETEQSEKEYSYLNSYSGPVVGDRVLVASVGNTYVILGRIIYQTTPITYANQTDLEEHTHLNLYNSYGPSHEVRLIAYTDTSNAVLRAATDGYVDLGSSDYRFRNIYATNGTISTSDEELKENIQTVDEKYFDFHRKLRAITCQMKGGTSGRRHVSFGARDVEKILAETGINTTDFAGFIKSPIFKEDEDGNYTKDVIGYAYGLRYEEFIPLEHEMVLKLLCSVELLNHRYQNLKGINEELMKQISDIKKVLEKEGKDDLV